jgi:hypothetical protein
MPLRDMRNLIGASAELASVREQARRREALQQALVDYTPVELADLMKASRVGYIKAGTLFLLADHTAAAAKLRQLLPRLLPVFHELEPEVTAIKVQVQVASRAPRPVKRSEKNTLPIDYIDNFESLAQSVRNPELKSAITNLVRRRRKSQP